MANEDAYYNINGQLSGIRFYNGTPLIGAAASLSSSVDVSADAGIFRGISLNAQAGSVITTASARKIYTASSSIVIDASNLTAATEVRILGAYAEITSSLTVNAIKFAKSNANLSGSLSTSFSAFKFFYGSSDIQASVSTSFNSSHIVLAESIINSTVVSGVDFVIIYTANSFININSNLSWYNPIRFTPSVRYPGSIVPLISIDGNALTEQNRKYNSSIKQVYVENKNWNNTKSRYYKRSDDGKISFKLSWQWLPNDRDYTIDKGFARDYIKELANDLDAHTLKIVEYGENPGDIFNEQEYTVFITNYSENLIRRDLVSGVYLWDCSMDLEQI